MTEITKDTSVAEIVHRCPSARRVFDKYGLHGCGGEDGPTESLAFFAAVHHADVDSLVAELNSEIRNPSPAPLPYKPSLADAIYRRFFKAGVAVMLSVGCLWGAVNLLEIGLGGSFLQPRLLPAIHAHAHAMIFGWVGLFVMGFAYQSFPRFKYTTLWRPSLANLSFFLMLVGIALRVGAELLQPGASGLLLGGTSAALELAAILLFLVIILKTARGSMEPANRYEKFIFAAMGWFLVQAIASDVFFFAKATAASQDELVRRIALIDGPLRDIQLLGFAALIIAGVSQRLVPVVYGLGSPARDRQTLIFWLMNGSLGLNVMSYVLLLTTGNLAFVLSLELAYILELVWAVLLVIQLRIFAKAGETDRSLKFIRAAYVWLLIATAMMPLFPVYSVLTSQYFAHAYMGAHRHAFTVGFISMMIVGVSSRVVPILAGVDSNRCSSLWGPFLLLNGGNAGRVALQILTDFFPSRAYPLVGLTGFLEVVGLAWWSIELWRLMNLGKVRRSEPLSGLVPLGSRP